MSVKLQIVHELAEKQASELSNRESWIGFLETAARMYKYPFHEQIMIFTQRPEASACASIELWNKLKRRVKRGSKGIALIDDSGSKPSLKYVFDINDTEGLSENVRKPFIWELKQEHENAVISYLANRYDCSGGYLPDMLRSIAERLSFDFYEGNMRDIRYSVTDSYLEEYDDLNLESAFTEALTVSLTYSLMHRCGIDAGELFDAEDFQFINDFNTKETVYALGTAISNLSEQVLRDIEKAVKNYELQKKIERTLENGQSDIQQERGLPDAANIADGTNETTVEQIRTNEEKLPQTAPPDTVQHDAAVGETVPAPVRNGYDGEQATGTDDAGNVAEQSAAGQSGESVGMGTAHEQPENQSGGNNPERIDLQLTQPLPSVKEKTEIITPPVQKTETDGVSFSELFAGSAISSEAVDTLLRQGSNNRGGLKRVAAYYMKDKNPSECAEFIKNEYKKGGRGVKIGGKQTSLWFDETGMTFGDGVTALFARDSVHLTWEQVESRVRELINEGQYMPQSEIDKVLDFERKEVAESLLLLNRDIEDGYRFLSEEDNIGGFPEMEEKLSEKLKKPEQLEKIIKGLEDFYKAYEKDSSILRFRYLYKPQLLQRLYDLRIEPLKLAANDIPKTEYTRFITEDEIDAFFTRGGNIESSKFRTLSLYLNNHTTKEWEELIKGEYNNSGSSHALSGADDSDYNGFHGAITLSRGDYGKSKIEVKIKWSEAAKRIKRLISENRYMTQKELNLIPLYEKEQVGRSVISFFYGVPEDMYRPFQITTDYYRSKDIIKNILDNPKETAELIEKMKPIYEATHTDDRHYNDRKEAYEDLTKYHNGTFSLFPNLNMIRAATETAAIRNPVKTEFPVTAPQLEQLTLFNTTEKQQEIIKQTEETPNAETPRAEFTPAASEPVIPETEATKITQSDIDTAIINWNGDDESKNRVIEYMREHARERNTAEFLKNEYGGNPVTFVIAKGGAESVNLPWTGVQKRMAQLIEAGQFKSEEKPDKEHIEQYGETIKPEFNNITQDDIDKAIINWNGDAESKNRVAEYMREHARERNTANFLKNEYGGNLEALTITKDGAESVFLPWAKVQRRMAQIFESFAETQDIINDILVEIEKEKQEATQETELSAYERYSKAKETYPNHIVLSQAGDFYEFYGEDAQFTANAFGYTLVSRNINGQKIPLTGIPSDKADAVIKQINGLNRDVVLVNSYDAAAEYPAQEQTQTVKQKSSSQKLINFRITDDNLGEGGTKTKYNYNIEAIRTLKQIEAEERIATPDEQEILSKYVGWGGISEAFNESNPKWTNEYAELSSLLTKEEYEKARATTLNSFYTTPVVIKAIYKAIESMGFRSGNILDPGCGIGNFQGLLPESMKNSRVYGIEADSITGRIAQQLYQKNNIAIQGYEDNEFPDNFFDLAIGNIPFGSYKIADRRYEKYNFLVHDYFIAKTLDKVRSGGVIAFITSKGTMDKRNPEVRKYIAQRAELLGAVRLPNNAFLKNAGTQVTTDNLFLKKRDRVLDITPDWVHLGFTSDKIPVNSYFAENPQMILGRMAFDDMMYGKEKDTTCNPIAGANLEKQLDTAVLNIQGQIEEAELDVFGENEDNSIEADTHVRNFSYVLVTPEKIEGTWRAAKIGEGEVFYRENSRMYPVDLPKTTVERIKGMIALRDCVHDLINYQLNEYGDWEIRQKQAELNSLYDSFRLKYGLINSSANNQAFSGDSAYYLLCSLEILDEDNKLERKADIFTKRTIKQKTVVRNADTSVEALALSISEKARVDLPFMQSLTGFTVDKIIDDLEGIIFCDIGNPNKSLPSFDPGKMKLYEKFPFVTSDEYLSGNVREKLAKAIKFCDTAGENFQGVNIKTNIKALEAVQPKDLEASEIAVRLGATWIDGSYVNQFMHELLQTPFYLKDKINATYYDKISEWHISQSSNIGSNNVLATVTYGTAAINAYQIIEETLNLKEVRIYKTIHDKEGKEKRVIDEELTTKAQQKQKMIQESFKDWIFKDYERRQTLVKLYNEKFNNIRPRQYNGNHLKLDGISSEIKLDEHQLNAIARIIYGGNTLLAQVVGAGKTYEMTAGAMELKRLGLCHKSLFAVPNHLTEQIASDFLRLYPSANILVATKKDFESKNRRKFCARIATGDYDAVIIGHSQLMKIPISKERQTRHIEEQIFEITQGIKDLGRSKNEKFLVKRLEGTKKSLEARLKKLTDDSRKDDVVTFEQLGVDRLFIDEADSFKEL